MAGKTVTLVMNGDVPLETFTEGVVQFQKLMRALSREIGHGSAIRWTLSDLEFGSADMSFVGEAEAPELVEGVARAFFTVGQVLASGKPIPYRQEVAIPARALSELVGSHVTSIEFRADDEFATVSSAASTPLVMLLGAYGAVAGQVETLRMRGGLRFTLYDDFFDRPVRCSLRINQADLMRDIWGHKAIVEGWVERNGLTGIPERISDISNVHRVETQENVGYWQAAGVAPRREGEPLPEEVIRLVRDA